jgi:RNA polymerase sigma factor (sigma-70 family)
VREEARVPVGEEDLNGGSFEAWYRTVHARVEASVRLATGDRDLAADAADEALVRAYERWDRVSVMGSPEGWTVRVALNVARRRLRRRAVERRLLMRRGPGVHVDPEVSDEHLWAAVRALPSRQRTAVVLRYVMDLKEADIASVMKVTRSTVSTTLRDARASLQAALGMEERDVRPA